MSKISEDGLRYRQTACEYAEESEGTVASIELHKFQNGETTKIRAEVWYKLGTKRYPFTYFFRNLPTDEDLKSLEGKKVIDLMLQWGRMSVNDAWGKPKVTSLVLDGGEEFELQGEKDEYVEE